MGDNGNNNVTFVVRDPNKPMSLSRALVYLVIALIVVLGLLSGVGIWIKLFLIGWVFGG